MESRRDQILAAPLETFVPQQGKPRFTTHRHWLTIALFIALLVSPDRISAKSDVWSPFGLRGETVTALALAGPGDVYAGTSSGTILRVVYRESTPLVQNLDGASSPISAIAVDPANPDVAYAATNSGLFRSRDGGFTWTGTAAGPVGVVAIAVDPQDSGIVYASAGAFGLFRSSDAGENWFRTSLTEIGESPTVRANSHRPGDSAPTPWVLISCAWK